MPEKPERPVDVQVSNTKTSGALAQQEPLIDIKTGLTDGQRYLIKVNPAQGRPVLIAVHL